jgi:hypothetical protein
MLRGLVIQVCFAVVVVVGGGGGGGNFCFFCLFVCLFVGMSLALCASLLLCCFLRAWGGACLHTFSLLSHLTLSLTHTHTSCVHIYVYIYVLLDRAACIAQTDWRALPSLAAHEFKKNKHTGIMHVCVVYIVSGCKNAIQKGPKKTDQVVAHTLSVPAHVREEKRVVAGRETCGSETPLKKSKKARKSKVFLGFFFQEEGLHAQSSSSSSFFLGARVFRGPEPEYISTNPRNKTKQKRASRGR